MQPIRIAINGFGRIGRQVLKAALERHPDDLEVVAVNDLFDATTNAHLLAFDTSYGRYRTKVAVESGPTGEIIRVGDWSVRSLAERDPANLPWAELGVDVVVESTGIFRTGPQAATHIRAGARKVVITAPAKEEDVTVVLGVNEADYDPERHHVISNASCTTNCLAPVAKVVHEAFGIAAGTMTTVHAYTNDQRILDLPHKDLRRARAAACNIIPTTTGAAKAVGKVIPDLAGRIDGFSLRVPVPTVSVVDFTCVLERPADTQGLRELLKSQSEGSLSGILGWNERPLVSSDFIAESCSGVVERDFTSVSGKTLAKIMAWYDNEWGYSCRVADLCRLVAGSGRAAQDTAMPRH